jgi:hypothetical protein
MASKGEVIKAAYARDSKVRNRHTNETGIVVAITVNQAGIWYQMETERGSSLPHWHESDIQGAPRTVAPASKGG